MGNFLGRILQSVKKQPTPQSILGVEKMATLQEVDRAYRRLAYSSIGNHDVMVSLNDAVDRARHSLVMTDYTEEQLQKEFPKYAIDFFERAILLYRMNMAPRMTDSNFQQFYTFWMKFRHENKEVEREMRRVVKTVKKLDPRVNHRVGTGRGVTTKKEERKVNKVNEKVKKEWKYKCEKCKKGFKSVNTFKDHLRSLNHKKKTEDEDVCDRNEIELVVDENTVNEESIKSIKEESEKSEKGENIKEESIKSVNEESIKSINEENEKSEKGESINSIKNESIKDTIIKASINSIKDTIKEEITNKKTTYVEEHPMYRTCSYCNKILESRGKLITHIRETHLGTKK